MEMPRGVAAFLLLSLLGGVSAARVLPRVNNGTASQTPNVSCKPEQIHLALTDDSTEMRVQWKTAEAGCDAIVVYGKRVEGTSNPVLTERRAGRHISYGPEDMCGAPAAEADYDPPHLHTAVLTGLKPGHVYQYQFDGHAELHQFKAPPATNPSSGFTFIHYGDMGTDNKHPRCPGSLDTAQAVAREVDNGVELVLHVGDIAYADSREYIWNEFMEYIEPITRRVPYMIGIGNHEYDYHTGSERMKKGKIDPSGYDGPYEPDWGNYGNDSGGECGVAVTRRFLMPQSNRTDSATSNHLPPAANPPSVSHRPSHLVGADDSDAAEFAGDEEEIYYSGAPLPPLVRGNGTTGRQSRMAPAKSNSPFWYSFTYASVHFVMVSTEHDLEEDSDQVRWLEAEFARVDRCKTPWLVVGMHRPMYVVYPHKSNRIVGEHLRNQLEDLYNKAGVDLVLSGHVHSYSRTCNVFDRHCVDQDEEGGMTHVIVGSAGHKLSRVDKFKFQHTWLEYAERAFGYARITVENGDYLTVEFVGSEDGEVNDSVTITNRHRSVRAACAAGNVPAQRNPERHIPQRVRSEHCSMDHVAAAVQDGELDMPHTLDSGAATAQL